MVIIIIRQKASIFASISGIKKQFNVVDPEIVDKLIGLDPTANVDKGYGGKYSKWLITMHQKGKIKDTDYNNITDALDSFDKNKHLFEIKDIFKYKDFETFLNAVHDFNNRELTPEEKEKLQKKAFHTAGDKDIKLLAEDGNWQLWQPLTYEGSVKLARYGGEVAKWCTAYSKSSNYYDRYTESGQLYIFINTENPREKYQWHKESNSFADINDNVDNIKDFLDFVADKSNIQDYFDVQEVNGLTIMQGQIVSVDKKISGHIDIPGGVTSIGSRAFKYCSSLTSITIPDSVTTIGELTFYECSSLTSVAIGSGVTSIGDEAFEYCSSLTSITIPDSVTTIGVGAFLSCASLKSITIPDSVAIIKRYAFSNCSSLTTITIPSSVSSIGNYAFCECSSLVNITIPNSVTSIESSAFSNCSKLISITIPDSVNSIEAYTFSKCSSLTNIVIPNSVTSIGYYAFYGCPNLTIYCSTNSYAFEYAIKNTIPFELTDSDAIVSL